MEQIDRIVVCKQNNRETARQVRDSNPAAALGESQWCKLLAPTCGLKRRGTQDACRPCGEFAVTCFT